MKSTEIKEKTPQLTSLVKTYRRAAAAKLLGESSKLRPKTASIIVFAILKMDTSRFKKQHHHYEPAQLTILQSEDTHKFIKRNRKK